MRGKRVMRIDMEGRRRWGRPKGMWMGRVNVDLREKGLSGAETQNQHNMWRQMVSHIDPTYKLENMRWNMKTPVVDPITPRQHRPIVIETRAAVITKQVHFRKRFNTKKANWTGLSEDIILYNGNY